MNSSISDHSRAQEDQKQEYHSPQLKSVGTLRALTQGVGSVSEDGTPCGGNGPAEQCL